MLNGNTTIEFTKVDNRRSWNRGVQIGMLVVLVALFAGAQVFSTYWVTQEARTYYSGNNPVDLDVLNLLIFPDGSNARPLSVYFADLATRIFGPSIELVNTIQLLLLAIAILVFYIHTLSVTGYLVVALAATFLTVFSSATLNMLLWQATQHDKLMIIFTGLVLMLHYQFVTLEKQKNLAIVLFSLGLVILAAAAYNSKETALFIVPCLFAQVFLFDRRDFWSKIRGFIPAIVVAVYSIWFFAIYFINLDDSWGSHISSGNPSKVGIELLGYLFHTGNFMNLGEWGVAASSRAFVLPLLIATSVAVLALGVTSRFSVGFVDDRGGIWRPLVYFVIMGVTVMALSLRTAHPSAYYVFVPQWVMGVIMGLAIVCILRAKQLLVLLGIFTVVVFAVCQLFAFAAYFQSGGAANRLLLGSRGISDTAAFLRIQARNGVKHFVIRKPDGLDGQWYLLQGVSESIDPDLAAFVFRTRTSDAPLITGPERMLTSRDVFWFTIGDDYTIVSASAF
jgi:hypothetical protein